MSDYVIKVENLGKSYQIRHKQESYTALRDVLADGAKSASQALLRRNHQRAPETREEFWALKDVSFEVKQGERLGIIGRNGAGKSTLLKVLSRITEPTRGEVRLRGRVASLLEVGTGFHPELTGRENIYLNGAILGMTREEIRRKFDEIVAFAEVERFLDTPVKRYSSGMYVRLAFAVAAHLEPEILLVDEVLAVGDAGFQKKSLGRMSEVSREGRTVLFVSHNMAAVESLCNRCLNLSNGVMTLDGPPKSVITKHLARYSLPSLHTPLTQRMDRVGSGEARFTEFRFLDSGGNEASQILMGEALTIEAEFVAQQPISEPVFGFLFADSMGKIVMRSYSFESHKGPTPTISNTGKTRCHFQQVPLMPGLYHIHAWLSQHRHPIDFVEHVAQIEVLQSDIYGTGHAPDVNNGGVCFALHQWEFTT